MRKKLPYTATRETLLKSIVKRRWPEYGLDVEGSRPYKKGARLILVKDPSTGKPVHRVLKFWSSNREALIDLQNRDFNQFSSAVGIKSLIPELKLNVLSEKVQRASQVRKAINLYTEASKLYEHLFGVPLPSQPTDRLKRELSNVKANAIRDAIIGGSSK